MGLKSATTLALVGAGVGMVLAAATGGADDVGAPLEPGNLPMNVDLTRSLDRGAFAGPRRDPPAGFRNASHGGLMIGREAGYEVLRRSSSDKRNMLYGGVGLIVAGTVLNVVWPDSPVRRLDFAVLPGGARVGASFGFGSRD